MQIKDAIRLKRPTLVFKKNGSSINMLLPGNKKNHLITYNWQNIISMNYNIFYIIHISLIRKINIFLYSKKSVTTFQTSEMHFERNFKYCKLWS